MMKARKEYSRVPQVAGTSSHFIPLSVEEQAYASTFPHCSMKSSEYLWPKTKRLVKDERRSKSKLRVCA